MRATVPSTPATPNDAANTLACLLAAACCSKPVSDSTLVRSLRDKPEPFSITGGLKPGKFFFHHAANCAFDASKLAARPLRAPSDKVKNTCCAITLLENLLMSAMMSDSGSDSAVKNGRLVRGTTSSRTLPVSLPPEASHIPSITRAA